jgi:glycosyltransferase involved in cell wall biosynthesis
MRQADGVIFLTEYARDVVMMTLKHLHGQTAVIPHGVNRGFDCPPRPQEGLESYSFENPFRLLYVSIVTVYKHQWHVAEAVARLRQAGLPIQLELVGPAYPPALKRLQATLQRVDPAGEFIQYRGPVSYAELHQEYQQADAFVFASSCETFGQIVTEAMAAGLPIVCSNMGALKELVGDSALYFDPEQPDDIATAIRRMMTDSDLRKHMAASAYERSHAFSWEKCANDTFEFLARVKQRE